MNNSLRNYCFVLFTFCVFTGCKVSAPVDISSNMEVPATYRGYGDSTTIADIKWKNFFSDKLLISLIDTALRNNRDLEMAIQRIEIARADFRIRRGANLPTLNAEAVGGVRNFSEYSIDGVGNYDTNLSENIGEDRRIPDPTPDYFLGLRSSWEIDLWGKLKSRRKAAYARLLASEKGVQLIKTALVSEVATLYYELLAYDNELKIISENIKLQETAVEMISLQKIGGRATELAVKQFTAQLLNTKSRVSLIKQNITATENRLNLLLGRYPQPIYRGKPINMQKLPEEVNVGVPSEMLLNRPDIQMAELELVASKENVQAARAEFFPSLTINSFAGFHSFKAGLLFNAPESIAYGLIGGLISPIFNRYVIRSEYSKSIAVNRRDVYSYQQAILTGFEEVYTSLKNIENLEKVATFKEQEVEVLNQATSIANDLFLAGYASYLEVVTAQKNALEAELQLTNTRKEQFLSIITLYRALGGGWK